MARVVLNLLFMLSVIHFIFYVFCNLSFAATTSSLERCLSNNLETPKTCAEKNIKNLTLNNCFNEAENLKSNLSKENLKQFCFYQVSEFPTLSTCLNSTEKMTIALNHDEAVFECVRQFQDRISESQCRKISVKLKYSEKSQHLNRLCDQL
jgi:hypothetical protein